MKLLDGVHERYVLNRRVAVLATGLAAEVPDGATVLDVGCGDGKIAEAIMRRRPDVRIRGIDVLVRPDTAIPVEQFDGAVIPAGADEVDVVMFTDVLHHTDNATQLLGEARRVARTAVVLKDHLVHGIGAARTLRFMDDVGNERHGVDTPYHYFDRRQWDEAFEAAGLDVVRWHGRLGIYPWPASMLFDRRLHFIAALRSRP